MDGLDDVHVILDDHFIKTISIRSSAFVKPIENEVKEWFDTVNRMIMTLEEWSRVQIRWLYLMPIFNSNDIVIQMPEEGVLFNVSDRSILMLLIKKKKQNTNYNFQKINLIIEGLLKMVGTDLLAIKCIGQVGVLESLINCTEMMETINLGVNNYLEKKRLIFPR